MRIISLKAFIGLLIIAVLFDIREENYLSSLEKQEVIQWLQHKGEWNWEELIEYLQKQYQVSYSSLQSYYQLFNDAGISWHKGVKKNKARLRTSQSSQSRYPFSLKRKSISH
ncbi:winged helix-turn-helix domain-containing protein [Pleurocapsa sp. PCC 7327]|uniref:winged helix-turn-helix domain-containing protein n=1 Tax=Pleurocapsa sp. PCC 7327 TaxID=118163 RepID=UPI0002DD910D|nr:winged helix-turn-helix domain-containing protein [Pleurocapsa sp. PCC 7327]